MVQHDQKSTEATPPPGGYATSHTFETLEPPSSLHPGALPITPSQKAISTKQKKNHRPNLFRESARRPAFPVCPAPTTAGSAKMNETLAQHFWILPITTHGSEENVLFYCTAEI